MTETYTLAAGTTVYHGTRSEEEFEDLNGPAWVSQDRGVAEEFVEWHDAGGAPRILEFKTVNDLTLALFESSQDIEDFVEGVLGEPDGYMSPMELAEMVCDEGYDGWIIPNNYGSSDDTMLCNPERDLELVGIEAAD